MGKMKPSVRRYFPGEGQKRDHDTSYFAFQLEHNSSIHGFIDGRSKLDTQLVLYEYLSHKTEWHL